MERLITLLRFRRPIYSPLLRLLSSSFLFEVRVLDIAFIPDQWAAEGPLSVVPGFYGMFTPGKSKCAALTDILDAINTSQYADKLLEAKENAGNDMLKMMQYVFPIIVQIQMAVIKNYGFPEGRDGIVHFSQLIRNLERDDDDVGRLHSQIRAHFLPPVHINTEASL